METQKINGQRPCHFVGRLKVAQLNDSIWEVLLEPFHWEFGSGCRIHVPAGVVSDGGPSVPPYPVFLAIGFVVGGFGGALLWLILSSAFLPIVSVCGMVGFVLGGVIRHRIRPAVFKIVGFLHDWLRVTLSTGNATTDAMLRDAAYWNRPDKLTPFDAWLIYLGVRIGTYIGFKSNPPEAVIADAVRVFAEHLGVSEDEIEFVPEMSLVRLKQENL